MLVPLPRIALLLCMVFLCAPLAEAQEPLPSLSTVAQIRALSREEAAKEHPVRIQGMVTYNEPQWFLTFVQDTTGGIYISAPSLNLQPGDLVVVTGVTAPGRVGRIITGSQSSHASVQVIGHGTLPAPIRAEPELLKGATYDAQWIEVKGEVRAIQRVNDRAVLDLRVEGQPFRALIAGYPDSRGLPDHLRGMPIIVTGVLGSSTGDQGEFTGSALHVTSEEQVTIEPEFLERQFARPALKFDELFHTNSVTDSAPVLVRGVANFVLPGRGFFMTVRDPGKWGGSIWVQTSQPLSLKPEQMVEVLGRPERSNRRPVLRGALTRPGEMGPPRSTQPLDADQITPEQHGTLITTEGTLLEQRQSLSEGFLVLTSGRNVFCARLDTRPDGAKMPVFQKGSRLRISGVYVDTPPHHTEAEALPFTFQIWMNDTAEVEVISSPPWWTAERIARALLATGLIALLAFGWAVALRRKVLAQTSVIRQQLEREAVHQERTRIARDFHDTLEQHFAGLGMQLDAIAASIRKEEADLSNLVHTAREMARHSREEARHVIWELRAPDFGTNSDFSAVLGSKLRPIAERADLTLEISISGTPRPLPARVENHLLRIAQEALTNTLKHAGASRVNIRLGYTTEEVDLQVSDDGRGLPPDSSVKTTGRFGLCGMRERADRMNGHFDVSSAPGRGVMIAVRLPLSQASTTA